MISKTACRSCLCLEYIINIFMSRAFRGPSFINIQDAGSDDIFWTLIHGHLVLFTNISTKLYKLSMLIVTLNCHTVTHIWWLFQNMSVAKHWPRLPRKAAGFPALGLFKTWLHADLSNLLCLGPFEQGVGLDDLQRSRPT